MAHARLPLSFYRRDALDVARALLGKRLRRDSITLEITEVEAYRAGDSAAHSRHGRTERNAPMWGPPGRAYVYLCYGLHQMLNVVTDEDGAPGAVLIRACRPVDGLDLIRARRGGRTGPVLLTGPGKVGQALALDGSFNGHRLHTAGGMECLDGPPPPLVLAGRRIGIDYASAGDAAEPWRFAAGDCTWVTHRTGLSPVR